MNNGGNATGAISIDWDGMQSERLWARRESGPYHRALLMHAPRCLNIHGFVVKKTTPHVNTIQQDRIYSTQVYFLNNELKIGW
jgi:hypothetical protein